MSKINMKEKFADPTFDLTFKMLFGNENHKDILISLLNSLLGFKGDKEKLLKWKLTQVSYLYRLFPVIRENLAYLALLIFCVPTRVNRK